MTISPVVVFFQHILMVRIFVGQGGVTHQFHEHVDKRNIKHGQVHTMYFPSLTCNQETPSNVSVEAYTRKNPDHREPLGLKKVKERRKVVHSKSRILTQTKNRGKRQVRQATRRDYTGYNQKQESKFTREICIRQHSTRCWSR